MIRSSLALFALGPMVLVSGCSLAGDDAPSGGTPATKLAVTASARPAVARADLPRLERADFNRLAALENVPLFWLQGDLLPANVLRTGVHSDADVNPYLKAGAFTPAFDELYVQLVERRRLEAVQRELDFGWPTAVVTDLRQAPEADRKVVQHIARAADYIEDIYAQQVGSAAVKTLPVDAPSKALLKRNQSYRCEAPLTKDDPFCNASLTYPRQRSDAYPADVEQNEKLCEELRTASNSKALLDPFAVVRKKDGKWAAVPYLEVYGVKMKAIAAELRLAAQALGNDEAAFRNYLEAAAKGFETNTWDAADEAWVAMNSQNSKWYLRIAPDEVYFDPCNSKAGFHVSFARINTSLLQWTQKLTPLRDEMEKSLADLIGKPYSARKVSFNLPDFIDIVLNAGDARSAFGGTIGQSLPNWGPVAERGAGRTVVMMNLYDNPDSRAFDEKKAALLFHPDDARSIQPGISEYLDTLLHEAAHNFGPHSDYQINGQPIRAIIGGLNASIMEELKAQTASLWYTEMLRKKGLLDDATARSTLTGSLAWAFGHISRGLFDNDGKRSVYSTIAAIHIGYFVDEGALSFDPLLDPQNSGSKGRFRIYHDRLAPAVEKLMQRVGRILATGDKADAEVLIKAYTEGAGLEKIKYPLVQERLLKFPKESFSYAIKL